MEKGGRLDIQAILDNGIIINIELPKFRKAKHNMDEKINQWLVFLDGQNEEEIEMAIKKNKIIKEAKVELNYLTGEDEVRRLAELRDKWESDWNSYMEWVRVEGEEQGKRKGKKEGKKEGEEAKQKEMTKAMLNEKIPIEVISRITGLTKKEIQKLK